MTKQRARELVKANHPDRNGGRWRSGVARVIYERAVQALKRRYNKCDCGAVISWASKHCGVCVLKFRRATKLQIT